MDHDRLLIDTHVLIWLMEGDDRIRAEMVGLLEEASTKGRLCVSAVSLWEVAALASAGRVGFTVPVESWLEQAISTPGLSVIDISPQIAAESALLPAGLSGDAVDRILAATARVHPATLVTADARILDYGALGHVRVAPAA